MSFLWLPKEAVIAIHRRQIAEHGGRDGLRDEKLLESSLARPSQLLAYGDPPPDLATLAAAYAFGISRNHPFFDGNKRTALITARILLLLHGANLIARPEDKLAVFVRLAGGEITETDLVAWIRDNLQPLVIKQ